MARTLRIQTSDLPLTEEERATRFESGKEHVESIRKLDLRIEQQKAKLTELKELREEHVDSLMNAIGGARQQTLAEATEGAES
jgi:hypothetical protein